MKRFIGLALVALLVVPSLAAAAKWNIDPVHSTVGFEVGHIVGKVRGQFTEYEADIRFDPKEPGKASADVTIQAASIDTRNAKRDEHLRSADFFDVANHPTLTFKSTKVTVAGENHYKVDGDLTMRGVTRPVVLDVTFNGTGKDPNGVTRAGFVATTTVNRRDFGLPFGVTLEGGRQLVGDEVSIELLIEATEDSGEAFIP